MMVEWNNFELTEDFKKIFDYWHESRKPYYSPYHIDAIKAEEFIYSEWKRRKGTNAQPQG